MSWAILESRASVMSVLVRTSCSIELIKRLLPRAPAGSVSGSMLISEQNVVKRPLTFESASCGMVRSWHSLRTCICCLGSWHHTRGVVEVCTSVHLCRVMCTFELWQVHSEALPWWHL